MNQIFVICQKIMYFNVVAIGKNVYSKLTDRMFAPTFLFIRQVKKLISNLATMSNQGPNKFSMREYGSQRGTRGLRFLAYDWSADTNGII